MITKNAKYGETNGVVVAEMGTGDIELLGSEKGENGSVHLAFKTAETPRPINVMRDAEVETYDEFQPEIVFIFNKVESIDAVINVLQRCRDEMLS